MANEITASIYLKADKSDRKFERSIVQQKFDMTGNALTNSVQSIGTSAHEALTISADVGTAGWAYFRNVDSTNYVEIGIDVSTAFHSFVKLLPGEFGIIPLSTSAPYAKANTAAVDLEYCIIER